MENSSAYTMVVNRENPLTPPAFFPSCVALPLTLKVTPFGALDFMSRFAVEFVSSTSNEYQCAMRTSSNVVKVSIKNLASSISMNFER